MPTLYNQYIYRNGAWRQTGTSSDSITYQISLSGDILTLTGSDGSTSSVTVSGGGGSSDIFVAEYNITSNADVLSAYNAGKAIFAIYDHIVYGLVNYTVGSGNPTNIFRFYAPDQGLRVKEVLCQLQNGTTTVWQNSAVSTRLGNITEDGDITGNGVTIANGDRLIINDESASKLDNSSITFGTDTTKYLANNGTWQSIPDVSGKQDKPTITSATLAVASWSNGVYSFESTYPNASYNIDVEPDGYTITDAQFKAWNEAKIVGNSNGNTIKALGTVPTVAIPIVVRATPK